MGVNADGKINLSVGIDEGQIKQSASQIKSILKKEISTINLDQFFDDKKIQQEVQQTIDSINKTLSKSKFKRVDFSSLIPKVDSIMSNTKISEKQRSNIVSGFGHQFEALDKYANKDIIPLLSNSKVFEDYLTDLTNIVDFVKSIKGLSTKEQDRMIKDLSKADASDIETAFTLKDIEKKYGANIKYKIKPKDIVPLLQKSIENMDVTDESQLKDFLGVYNRGKYLAQMDTSKSGVFRTFFEQFQKQHHQELEAFRTQYPDLFAKMEREVIGMSKDFDTLYNAKYKNKSLDTTDLVKGLKINKTASQIHNAQVEKAPTTSQELADTVLSVQSDVDKLDEKVEKAEQLANEAKEAANEVKKEINNTNKNANKNKTNATNIEKKDLKDTKQKNEQQSSPALEQAKEEIDNAIETEKTTLEKLQQERSQLETEKEINESVKAKLEKRNETINKVIKNNFKDESKKSNYDNLKKQHDNYKNKKEINDKAWEELDSLERFSPEWKVQLSKAQQTKEEEEKAWVKYYKAFDIAKNGKNNVAKSRLDKFDPKNEGLTEFDNKTFEIYIQSLKEAMARNKEVIDDCEKELEDYRKKKEELDKKINELSKDNNITNNNTSPSSNKSNEKKTSKPKISIDLQQELGAAFGFDFNDTDESSDITSTAQAEKDLQENTSGANKALEEQKNITEGIVKTAETLVYHMGQINGDKTVLSNIFGSEIQNPNGHNIGTGLYATKTPKEYTKPVLSNEDLDNYYAIDTSELKMYEAHAEETAKEFYDFIHRLEQFCIMMGSGFEGFDDNLENIDEEALYSTAQKIFPNLEAFFNDFDEFDEYINEMITLVSKSGIGADGTINPIKMRLFQKEFGTDDIKTRFLKQLGYQGVDLSGTSFGKQLGNIVFNPLDNSKILSSGKDINQVVKEVVDKIGQSQKNESKTSESSKRKNDSTNTKKAIAEQEELEEKTKKATDALKDQQQTLAQTNAKSPSQSTSEEETKKDDVGKNKTKPKTKTSARVKKPVKSPDENEVKPDSNEVAQGEADSANGANNEASGFKLIAGSAEEAAEAKRKFVEANKDVLQSIIASMPKIEEEAEAFKEVKEKQNTDSDFSYKEFAQSHIKGSNPPFEIAKQWIDSGIKSTNIDKLKEYYKQYEDIVDKIKTTEETSETKSELESLTNEYDNVRKAILAVIDAIDKENSEENKMLASQKNKIDTAKEQANNAKETRKGRKGYFDFEAMPNDLIEQRYAEISPFPVIPKGISLATDRLNDEVHTAIDSVELLEELHTAWDRSQQEIKDIIYDSTIENMQEEYAESQRPVYDFEPDYEDLARQAQEAREYYEEQISNDFEVKAEAKFNLKEDKTGQLSLFDDIIPEENWGQEIIQATDDISKAAVKGQISLQDLEEAEQRVTAQYAKLRSNKDFLQGEDVSEKFLESYEGISTEKTQELFKTIQELKQVKASLQDSFDKKGNLIGDPLQVEDTYNTYIKLIDIVKRLKTEITGQYSEETIALKLKQDAEKAKEELEQLRINTEQTFAKISSSKEFIQGKSLNADYISKFGVFDNTKNLEKLSRYFAYLEKTKSELSSSFDRQGQLIGDPTEVNNLISQYNTLIEEIKKLKLEIESPHSEENIILQMLKDSKKLKESLENLYPKLPSLEKITPSIDKVLQPFREMNLPVTESRGQLLDSVKRMQEINSELSSSFDAQGKLIGSPKRVQELILEYKNLIKQIDELKAKISSPMSEENIALKLAKDAEKAKKQLDELKEKVDKTLGKSNLFEAQTQKTINDYGAFNGDGEGQRTELINPEALPTRFKEQQEQVQNLVNELEKYKKAIEELRTLRASDDATLEQLTEADNKVKTLKESITNLSGVIKTSGIANASEEQIGALRNKIESFLNNTPNLTKDVRAQLQDYIKVLDSGASVSKTKYASMTADLNKFKAAQASGSTIWEQMVGKMREGIAFLATKFSFYQIFNQFRQGFQVIRQFDDALTEMMKVSDETRTSLERYQKTTFDTADAIGSNALQIQNSTADFMRLGETLNQAAESAKSANVLMNVSEFQNIDEATKSLIAMGAAYDDLSKMNIIDKLNEVGNNYAISTSEAATALQSSASALKTAGNDMDEALALITAGNAVVQDATKVGTGMRTIALRLTGTKSAKEELEEMGEETENVITTQSKLRDTIKQATAVASNEFKGFDILDDNGNYKSTYEIMLGIADVYDEIVETDKKLGRNNVNLLLESVAGKNRANIAASIFQNPQLLRDAYQSSQDANGSAMRENDKYVQSISGHLAQLTNAWQRMWANAANRDVINFFIDLAKAAVNLANTIGVLPTTFALLLPYINLITKVRSKDKQGIVTQFLEWANGLNEAQKAAKEMAEAQKGLNAVKEASIAINTAEAASTEAETAANVEGTAASVGKTVANEAEKDSTLQLAEAEVIETGAEEGSTKADIEGAGASAIKAVANSAEAGSNAAAGVDALGKIGTSITKRINLITGAISGLAHSALAIPLAIGAAITAIVAIKKIYDAHRESVFSDAKVTTENIKTQQDATAQQIESYKQLKSQLDSGDLSEEETIAVKQQILDVQKSINEQYGTAAQGVDLINGKLEEQVELLNSISQKEAQDQYYKNLEGYQVAEEEYERNRTYNVKLNGSTNASLNKSINDAYAKAGLQPISVGMGNFNANVNGTASDVIDTLENAKKSLEELKKEYRDPDSINAINKQIKEVENQIGDAYEVVNKYEETALKGIELKLATNNTNGYDTYKNYQSSVSNLENAYITGDAQKINEARKAYDEATKAKDEFLKVGDNGQFALLFNKIDTSLIDTKNRFKDTVEILKDIPEPEQKEGLFDDGTEKVLKKNSKGYNNLTKNQKKAYNAAKKLYDLNPDKVDIQATLDDNTYASGKYADALNDLMNAMGWTTADADTLINALVTAGVVHGDTADAVNFASDSYNIFSSSVEEAITSLNSLNTALSESAKGTGLTEQTLTELRSAFGDNLDSVLEKTANGYHLNTEGAYLLRQQQEALVNADYASAMYEQYNALDKVQEGFIKAKEAGEDTSGFVQQKQAIQDNIDKLNEQLMAFNNANSAYQTWLAKQNSEGEREMYNSVYSGYDAVKDELERGWAGEKTRSWLDLIFNDEGDEDFNAWTSSAEEVRKKFKEVTKDIEGTGGYSIADFFTVDSSGKSTSEGVWNFFEAIENKQKEVGKEFVNLEEGWFDFTKNGDYQIADMLGMDIESVHAVLRAAADAGFEIHLDQPLFSLEQLTEKANTAKEAIEEATGAKLKINLDPQSETEVDSAMQKLVEYQQVLSQDTSIDPNVKTERLQQIADLMNFLAAKKREFVEGKVFDLDILNKKELEESKNNINEISNLLSSISKDSGNTQFSKQFAIDPMLLNNVDYLQEKLDALKEIRPNVDDSQVQLLDQLLEQLQYRIDFLNGTDLSGGTITVDQFMAAEQVVNDINAKLDYAAQHKDIQFDWSADESFIQNLQLLSQLPDEVKTEFGIDPNASAEELLELAKSGELHLQVKTSGEVPKTGQNTETYETVHRSEEVTLGVTTIGTEFAKDELQTLAGYDGQTFETTVQANTEQANADLDETLTKADKVGNTQSEAEIKADNSQANNATNETSGLLSAFDGTSAWGYIHVDTGDSYSKISSISNAIRDIPSYKSTTIETIEKHTTAANGTAHAQGTAFVKGSAYAGGKWGLPNDQTALTGELGTEIIVRDGNWFTVGDDGAEFVNLKKGDINKIVSIYSDVYIINHLIAGNP